MFLLSWTLEAIFTSSRRYILPSHFEITYNISEYIAVHYMYQSHDVPTTRDRLFLVTYFTMTHLPAA